MFEDIIRFFYDRTRRAWQMDAHNGLSKYWIEAEEWTSAYKNTLTKNKQKEFDKVWRKLEQEADALRKNNKL